MARFAAAFVLVFSSTVGGAAEPPPIAAFARQPGISGAAISPDGERIAYVSTAGERPVAAVFERQDPDDLRVVLASDEDKSIQWCYWANDKRLLCSLRWMETNGRVVFAVTRLAAVDADGSNIKVLMQRSMETRQFLDRVLDWTPDEPQTVLVEAAHGNDRYPSVFALDVDSGNMQRRLRAHPPIDSFATDGRGNVRLGWGRNEELVSYYARAADSDGWERLARFEVFSSPDDVLQPVAVAEGSDLLYATGVAGGRQALWVLDLKDRTPPGILYSHPEVDIDRVLLRRDGALLGVYYETDRPGIYYVDQDARAVMGTVQKVLPDTFNRIVDSSTDMRFLIVRAGSDVVPDTYYLLERGTGVLGRFATAYPEIDPALFGRMESLRYPAQDGTQIPAYLTVPLERKAENLPLVVMPHGGPISRTTWRFDFLRAFLVSRGYAVLEMNFRGSDGYGRAWFQAAHQDWGGLTYSDIADGARWAVARGIADPRRVAIVGWSFGGYAALLGATRDSKLFRCAASIAGISDLSELKYDQSKFRDARAVVNRQLGMDAAKLKADSPLRHVDDIGIPILLVHGNRDSQAEVDQSQSMARALERAHKEHEFVLLDGADHQLHRTADRTALLEALESFLQRQMAEAPAAETVAGSTPAS
jgi:dipeptidyl aminopeptidase/acylaminoacyl peptidase